MCLSVHTSKSRISWRFSTHKYTTSENTMHLSHSGSLHSSSIILPGRMTRSSPTRSMPALYQRIHYPLYPHTIKSCHAFFLLLTVSVTNYEKTTHSVSQRSSHTHMHNTDRINCITWADWLKIHNLPFSQRDALCLIETSPKYSPLHFTAVPPLKAPKYTKIIYPNIWVKLHSNTLEKKFPFSPWNTIDFTYWPNQMLLSHVVTERRSSTSSTRKSQIKTTVSNTIC